MIKKKSSEGNSAQNVSTTQCKHGTNRSRRLNNNWWQERRRVGGGALWVSIMSLNVNTWMEGAKNGGQREEEGRSEQHEGRRQLTNNKSKRRTIIKKIYNFIVLEKKQRKVEKRNNLRFYLHSESAASRSPPSCPVHWRALWELCYRVFTRWWCVWCRQNYGGLESSNPGFYWMVFFKTIFLIVSFLIK